MPTFSSTYPDELKADVVRAAMPPDSLSVAEVVRRANAGHYGEAGRRLKVSAARQWVKEARDDADARELMAGDDGEGPTAATIAASALELLATELVNVRAKARRSRKPADVNRLKDILVAAKEAERIMGAAGKTPGPGPAGEAPKAEQGSALARDVLQRASSS